MEKEIAAAVREKDQREKEKFLKGNRLTEEQCLELLLKYHPIKNNRMELKSLK